MKDIVIKNLTDMSVQDVISAVGASVSRSNGGQFPKTTTFSGGDAHYSVLYEQSKEAHTFIFKESAVVDHESESKECTVSS